MESVHLKLKNLYDSSNHGLDLDEYFLEEESYYRATMNDIKRVELNRGFIKEKNKEKISIGKSKKKRNLVLFQMNLKL